MVTKSNREHSFDVELAQVVGLEKSLLLKNISYWVSENKRRGIDKYFTNDIWWTEESLTSLAAKYPYMKRTSIGRWMQELHQLEWIRVVGATGGKNKYAPGPVFELWDSGGDWQERLSQNGTVQDCTKMGRQLYQNGTDNCTKMGHTNIELSNVDSNIDSAAGKQPKQKKNIDLSKQGKNKTPVIHSMVEIFENEHRRHFIDSADQWIGFTWQAKEFGALGSLKNEFEKRIKNRNAEVTDEAVLNGWQSFLQMAADADKWTVENHFTPTKLWSNFQSIIQKIQSKQNGKQQPNTASNGQSKADKQREAFANLVRDVAANGLRG